MIFYLRQWTYEPLWNGVGDMYSDDYVLRESERHTNVYGIGGEIYRWSCDEGEKNLQISMEFEE